MIINNANAFRGRKKGVIFSDINVTPLVDVMLVLLIVFMITAPMLVSGISVNLPTTSTTPALTSQEDPLVVTIDKNGDIYIIDTKIDLSEFSQKLKAITKEKMDTKIFVRGDKDANYGQVASIMVQINQAGFHKVALVTKNHD